MSKYASLPDLDQSQDVYETPDLADDVSTLPTTAGARTSSPTFSDDYPPHRRSSAATSALPPRTSSLAGAAIGQDGIDRTHLQPGTARSRFQGADIDAENVDFSDRVGGGGRRSYVVSSRKSRRRRRRRGGSGVYYGDQEGESGVEGEDNYGEDSEDEEPETPERKLARLRRELEELKAELAAKEDAEKREKEQDGEGVTTEGEAKAPALPADGQDVEGVNDDEESDGTEGKRLRTGITELSSILSALEISKSQPTHGNAEANLVRKITSSLQAPPAILTPAVTTSAIPPESTLSPQPQQTESQTPQAPSSQPSYTVYYTPQFRTHHSLARAADFDRRLTLLERVLGANSSFLANLDKQVPANAVIPTLDDLARQISVLTSSSAPFVDAISRRVKMLAEQAEKLAEARRQARAERQALANAAASSTSSTAVAVTAAGGRRATLAGPADLVGDDHLLSPSSGSAGIAGVSSLGLAGFQDISERDAKINALYGTLPTITQLAPLLPTVLDRLRSLRAIHADTGKAAEGLENVERRQEEMAEEILKWKEALKKVEEVMKDTEGVFVGNVGKVEGWVRELEERMEKVEELAGK